MSPLMNTAALSLIAVSAASSSAQLLYTNESLFIPPPPDVTGDFSIRFGWSVSNWDDLALVGAPEEDANGSSSGAAYLLDIDTGDQVIRFVPPDGSAGAMFGEAVALSEDYVVVGAPGYDYDFLTDPGVVFVYDAETGEQVHMLRGSGSTNRERFGTVLAVDGSTLVVGAPDFMNRLGAVYLFDIETGQEIRKTVGIDASPYDERFGDSVAISGGILAVGSPLYMDDQAGIAGRAFVFDVDSGALISELISDDLEAVDGLGRSVAVWQDTVFVGSPGHQGGAVYMFDAVSGDQLEKLMVLDDHINNPRYGTSMSVSNNTLLIGADNTHTNGIFGTGAVYVHDATTGRLRYRLYASDASYGDSFGLSVANMGTTAVVGAPRDDDGGLNWGSAYIFETTYSCGIDFMPNGRLDFFDVSAFIDAYRTQDPSADINGDGQLTFFDVSAFLQLFNNDCY